VLLEATVFDKCRGIFSYVVAHRVSEGSSLIGPGSYTPHLRMDS
jgi:hypothetical protein